MTLSSPSLPTATNEASTVTSEPLVSAVPDLYGFVMDSVKGLMTAENATDAAIKAQNAKPGWLLLGTAGCHLCEVALLTLQQFQSVHPITVQQVDIMDLDRHLDNVMMQTLATRIPVVITPNQQLAYPFSLLDLTKLLA